MAHNVSITQLGPEAQRQVLAQLAPAAPKPAKYRNLKTTHKSVQGFERVYDSKREAKYAAYLDTLLEQRIIDWWLPQVRIPLPGGVTYVLDFLAHYVTGQLEFSDVKGKDTQASVNKRKQVKSCYGINVEVIR